MVYFIDTRRKERNFLNKSSIYFKYLLFLEYSTFVRSNHNLQFFYVVRPSHGLSKNDQRSITMPRRAEEFQVKSKGRKKNNILRKSSSLLRQSFSSWMSECLYFYGFPPNQSKYSVNFRPWQVLLMYMSRHRYI